MKCGKTLNQKGFTLIEIIVTVIIVAILSAMILTFLSDSLVKSSDPIKWLKASSSLHKTMSNITADYNQYPKWKSSTNYSVGNRVIPVSMNGRYYTCISSGQSGASEPNWSDDYNVIDGSVNWIAGMWKNNTSYSIGDIAIPTNNYRDPIDNKKGPNGHFYRCKTAGQSGGTEPNLWPKTGGSTISDGGVQWTRLIQYLKEAVGTPDLNKKINTYGQYYVTANKYVKFISNNETDISSGEPENILKITLKNDEGETLTALFIVNEQ
jgi:prepilin-type N-terminal cleavage/methylation domain-containing protein